MGTPVRFPYGVTNAAKAGPLGMYGLPDPASWHTYFNDFDEYVVTTRWTETKTGAGTVAVTDADGGVLLITNAAADNDAVALAAATAAASAFAAEAPKISPADAAKRVVPDIVEERAKLGQLRQALFNRVQNQVANQLDLIGQIRSRPILANPYAFIQTLQTELTQVSARSSQAVSVLLGQEALRLDHLKQQVRSLSPQSTLDRGYAVVRDAAGNVLTDASKVKPGTALKVRIAKGEILATTN